jgi:hypothetical protein
MALSLLKPCGKTAQLTPTVPRSISRATALETQAKSSAAISETNSKSSAARSSYFERKVEQLERRAKRARLSDLKEVKTLGLISDQKFASQAQSL